MKIFYLLPISTERIAQASDRDILGMLRLCVDKKVLQFLDASRCLQLQQNLFRVWSFSLLGGVEQDRALRLKLSHLLGIALNRCVLHKHDQLVSLLHLCLSILKF